MPLGVGHIFNKLHEWPLRPTGSEDEMMARETLMTELLGEPGVEVAEEGLMVPGKLMPFLWFLSIGQGLAILLSIITPLISLLGGLVFLISYLLFVDGRSSPLMWMMPRVLGANLVASKGQGRRLIMLLAHLDTPSNTTHTDGGEDMSHVRDRYLLAGIMALGVVIPLLVITGLSLPLWILIGCALIVLLPPVMAVFRRHKPNNLNMIWGHDNLAGVAIAASAATHLWRHMPDNTEVRLVATTAGGAGHLGAQHYCEVHREELNARDTHVITFGARAGSGMGFITKSLGLTSAQYKGPLFDAAIKLVEGNQVFRGFSALEDRMGSNESIWFLRSGISTLAMNCGMHQAVVGGGVDDNLTIVAKFAEGIVRMLPPVKG